MSDKINYGVDRRKSSRRRETAEPVVSNHRAGVDRRKQFHKENAGIKSDRRSSTRISFYSNVIVLTPTGTLRGQTIDLSENGMTVLFKGETPGEQFITLKLCGLEKDQQFFEISLASQVIRVHDSSSESMVVFKFLETENQKIRPFYLDIIRRINKGDVFYTSIGRVTESLKNWNERYTYFRRIDSAIGKHILSGNQKLIMLSSNDYLGLTSHPKVKEAAIKAIERYGTGTGSTMVLSGTLDLHKYLEHKLAEFKGMESALLFGTGFMANAGTISTLFKKDYILLNDQYNHISIFEGCRFSGSRVRMFRHNDMEHLKKVLKIYKSHKKKALIVESVFSMDGDLAPLKEISALAREHGAVMLVDDAHASGVFGQNGRGSLSYFNLEGQVDIVTDSFGKAFAGIGGYVAGSKEIIDYLRHFSSMAIFTTSLSAATCATILAAMDVLESDQSLVAKFWQNVKVLREGLLSLGFDLGRSNAHILPVMIGNEALAYQFSQELQKEGIFANSVGRPAVPRGKARLRLAPMATHDLDDLERALAAFSKVGKKLHVIH